MKPTDPQRPTEPLDSLPPSGNPAAEAKSLLASKTVLGIAVALLPALLRLGHVELAEADLQATAGDVVTILGSAIAIYGRLAARQRVRLAPPKSDSVDLLLLAIALGALLWFTGCTGTVSNGSTRYVESVSLKGGASREGRGGATTGSGEIIIHFRDGRDGKTIQPLSLRRAFEEPAVAALGHGMSDPSLAAAAVPDLPAVSAR